MAKIAVFWQDLRDQRDNEGRIKKVARNLYGRRRRRREEKTTKTTSDKINISNLLPLLYPKITDTTE